jgi:predicted DNA-binding ribbon-helix-helix protein
MTNAAPPPAVPVSNSHNRDHRAAVKRSIVRDGHKSSISLEDQFWDAFCAIAERERMTVSALVGTIDRGTNRRNLSSAVRVFVLGYFRRDSEQRVIEGTF